MLPSLRLLLLSLIFAAIAPLCRAQLSANATYMGKIGSNDIVIGVANRDLIIVYYFDRTLGRTEVATGALDSQGRFSSLTTASRTVTFTTAPDRATGSLGGTAFTATVEGRYGAFASKSFAYSGTAIDLTSGVTSSYAILIMVIFPSGKVMLTGSNATGTFGGLGTINAQGAISIPVTTGRTFSFTFAPENGVASGQINISGSNPATYFLVQAVRAPIINIATRGTVGGSNSLTAGFVTRTGAKTLLIRAVGPTLGSFGVPNTQADPVLTLVSGSTVIATNDNWGSAPNLADIPAATTIAGAFPLAAGSKDSVLLVTLEPGAYTAQVTGTGTAGEALVEVYEIN